MTVNTKEPRRGPFVLLKIDSFGPSSDHSFPQRMQSFVSSRYSLEEGQDLLIEDIPVYVVPTPRQVNYDAVRAVLPAIRAVPHVGHAPTTCLDTMWQALEGMDFVGNFGSQFKAMLEKENKKVPLTFEGCIRLVNNMKAMLVTIPSSSDPRRPHYETLHAARREQWPSLEQFMDEGEFLTLVSHCHKNGNTRGKDMLEAMWKTVVGFAEEVFGLPWQPRIAKGFLIPNARCAPRLLPCICFAMCSP